MKGSDGEGDSEDTWDIVAANVPVSSGSGDRDGSVFLGGQIAQELDECQFHFKEYLSQERPQFREETGGASREEAVATAASLWAVTKQVKEVEALLAQLRALEEEGGEIKSSREQEILEVLQTRTVPLEEALEHWHEGWGDAAHSEIHSLTVKKEALREITEGQLKELANQGYEIIRIPTKVVLTIKATSARKKARAVLCGNREPVKQESALERRIATYAGGVDLGLLRLLLAEAVIHGFNIASWDVSTAFLNAPARPRNLQDDSQKQIIVGVPPKVLIRQGVVQPGTLYEVLLAVYGRDTSPRDWGLHRSETLERLSFGTAIGDVRFKKSSVDSSIWYVIKIADDQYAGWMAIYIDDFLAAGVEDVASRAYDAVNAAWECGAVEHVVEGDKGAPLRFDGFELSWTPGKTALYIGQPSYIRDLLNRHHPVQEQAIPLVKPLLDNEPAEPEDGQKLRECQKVLGELLYLAVRTRPDLMYTCSRLASAMSKRPSEVLQLTQGVLGYLAITAELGLVYRKDGATPGPPVIRAFSDAGFAPECSRSQECAIVYWHNSCIQWLSTKQPFVAQSTCEAELITIVTASNLAQSFQELARELRQGQLPKCIALNDNAAAILLASTEISSWRTRHLRIRANVLREKVCQNEWCVEHVPGDENVADVGTKTLGAARFVKLRNLLGLEPLPKPATKCAKASVKQTAALCAVVLAACVEPSGAVRPTPDGVERQEGDWALWFLLVIWTLAVLAVWEAFCWCISRPHRNHPEPDPEFEPPILPEVGPEVQDAQDSAGASGGTKRCR